MKCNRLILWLALAGMVLAVHLWIQKARGFDQGCLGLNKPVAVIDAGCREVDALPASHLLGVSNAAWGFAFYFGLALLSAAKLVVPPRWARGAHRGSEMIAFAGLIYSAYLVYSMVFVGGVVCWLCLTSALLVLAIFVLHGLIRRGGGFQPVAEAARVTELGFAGLAGFAAVGLLVVVLLFVNRLGTRPLDQGVTAQELESVVGRSLPAFIDQAKLKEMRACRIDPWVAPLDTDKIVPRGAPFIGRQDGLAVVAFYDPNCPHCAEDFPAFMKLAERYKERARFAILPRLLGARSMLQTEALKLAAGSGKYYELWAAFFQPRTPGKIKVADIAGYFRALGLDTSDLERRLDAAGAEVLADARRYGEAGVSMTPTLLIGGKRVFWTNLSQECLGRLIDEELADARR